MNKELKHVHGRVQEESVPSQYEELLYVQRTEKKTNDKNVKQILNIKTTLILQTCQKKH